MIQPDHLREFFPGLWNWRFASQVMSKRLTSRNASTSAQVSPKISQINNELDYLTHAIHSLLSRTSSHVLSRRHELDRLIRPINRLPNELLQKVFSLTLQGRSKDYHQVLHSLACVSPRWASLVHQCPRLWTYIHSSHSPHDYLKALTKSKSSLLDIIFDSANISEGAATDGHFLQNAFAHVARWQSAHLRSDLSSLGSSVARLFLSDAPFLQDLHMEHVSGHRSQRFVTALGGIGDRLRRLTLIHVSIQSGWESFSRLEVLHLHQLCHSPPSLVQLVDLLGRCPGLVVLCLSGIPFAKSQEAESPTTRAILLSSLHAIVLRLDPTITQYLLTRLRIPACRYFHVISTDPGSETNLFSESTAHLVPAFKSIMKSSSSMLLSISPTLLKFTATQGRVNLSIQISSASPSVTTLAWVVRTVQSMASTPPLTLQISGLDSSLTMGQLSDLLPKLSSVDELFLADSPSGGSLILRLALPVEGQGGTRQWLLPNIRVLKLHNVGVIPGVLMHMFKSRYSQQNGFPRIWTSATRPKKLERLEIGPEGMFDATFIKQIEEMVGKEKMVLK